MQSQETQPSIIKKDTWYQKLPTNTGVSFTIPKNFDFDWLVLIINL